jgi:DNA polymerase-3 subunit epsilon
MSTFFCAIAIGVIMSSRLKLKRPLAVFDIESTGINRRTDRIIDLAIIKYYPDGTQKSYTFRVHPECKIPPESTAIHGITDEDVKDCLTFKTIAPEVKRVLTDCDLGGYNLIYFDIPILTEEFTRAGMRVNFDDRLVFDAQKIFHAKEPRDLTAALSFYCGEEHAGAHSALDDTEATLKVILGQMEMYDDLPETMEEIDELCNQRDPSWVDRRGRLRAAKGKVVINFGKYQGRSVAALVKTDLKFLEWIIRNDFPRDTQEIIQAIIDGDPPEKWLPETPA